MFLSVGHIGRNSYLAVSLVGYQSDVLIVFQFFLDLTSVFRPTNLRNYFKGTQHVKKEDYPTKSVTVVRSIRHETLIICYSSYMDIYSTRK